MATTKQSRGNARRSSSRKAGPASTAGSFGEWLQYLGVSPSDAYWKLPYWPPDVFALVTAFLRRTGIYVKFANHAGGRRRGRPRGDPEAERLGREWRENLSEDLLEYWSKGDENFKIPKEIANWWFTFAGTTGASFSEAVADLAVQEAAWNLCIVSDVASRGIGVRTLKLGGKTVEDVDPFLVAADAVLSSREDRSFCLKVPVEKLAVLGKQHTPQRGCTIRSLTHHLALYVPSEIEAFWVGPWDRAEGLEILNLLLLPWPTVVRAEDFSMAGRGRHASAPHGYFEYNPKKKETPGGLRQRVARALKLARRQADQIHGIVFPELALTRQQYSAIEDLAVRNGAVLIAGVRGRVGNFAANTCVIQPYALTSDATPGRRPARADLQAMRRIQHKHHRWCLDREQILQYELGARITASRECWENIHLGQRQISFVTLKAWLTICVLICEDLARQDPITDVIRAVGPNLVFSLLMDGPQLKSRWPARYASVLAEDPGCSVLTLTSLGMSSRSKPQDGGSRDMPDRSSTVALWRDKIFGEREIALKPGDDACVLSLVCRSEHEYTLDGRHDEGQAHFPVYAGSHSFNTKPGRKPRTRA